MYYQVVLEVEHPPEVRSELEVIIMIIMIMIIIIISMMIITIIMNWR